MTALTVPIPETPIAPPPVPRPSLLRAWFSSIALSLLPRRAGDTWTRTSLPKAATVAAINLLVSLGWALLVALAVYTWNAGFLDVRHLSHDRFLVSPIHESRVLIKGVAQQFADSFSTLALQEKISLAAACILFLIGIATFVFFTILPFAVRTGSNKACIRHIFRCVMMATGLLHLWGALLAAAFIVFALRFDNQFPFIIGPLTGLVSGLMLWTFICLAKAANRDYRTPPDFPQPRDPTCECCGYNLLVADPNGRCPECGKSVLESLGSHLRPPAPWEQRPVPWNLRAVANQLLQLIRRPRHFFNTIPTLTGQYAAQRWLVGALITIALAAVMIIPAMVVLHVADAEWTLDKIPIALFVGLVWAALALMMVGVETTGIATFSRLRGNPVPLAAAAKVTAYSSPLMLLWVFLGAAQMLALFYAWDHKTHLWSTLRGEQIIVAVSFSLAHIGGLLWYELTVYRGIRSIQFANR